MATLARVACQHSQTTFTGLQKSLQHEWSFVQRITPCIGMAFQAVEDELRDTQHSVLFQGATYQIPGRDITGIPVKHAGIALYNPT